MSQSLVGTKSYFDLSVTASVLSGGQPIPYDTADQADAAEFARRLSVFFHACADGAISWNITQTSAGTAAAGLITLSSFVDADTVTVGITTLTGKNSPSNSAQFAIGGSDTITATNLAACINANPTLSQYVTASPSGATVLVTCIFVGVVGNTIPLAISAHGSVSASHLGSGTGSVAGAGTVRVSSCGL